MWTTDTGVATVEDWVLYYVCVDFDVENNTHALVFYTNDAEVHKEEEPFYQPVHDNANYYHTIGAELC